MKDLKWVAEGPDDLDNSDRARYFCKHWNRPNTPPPRTVCRACYQEGVERVRAVASQAVFISTKRIEQRDESSLFGVNYQVNNSGDKKFAVYQQCFKEEIVLILKLLSLHSADIDPRMLCLHPDLY